MIKPTLLFLLFLFNFSFAQDEQEDTYLKELSDNACLCIDSVDLYDRAKQLVIDEVSRCIDNQVVALQLGRKLKEVLPTAEEIMEEAQKSTDSTFVVSGKEATEILINTNKNSQEYKDGYYEIERYLMTNCERLQLVIASNEKQSEKSVSKDPESLRYYSLGAQEAKDGNHERAIEYYEEALRIDPNFAFAWDNIGIAYRRLDQYDKAIEAYNKSLELDPYGMMPLQNIAIAYQYKKEFKKAIEAFEKLGKVHPGNPEVYYGIGHIYAYDLLEDEKALDYACKAYLIYAEQNSPYRTDAEQMILILFENMKKKKNEKKFHKILKKHKIGFQE